MIDAVHDHESVVVVDLVDNAVGTSTSGVEAGEFALERAADAMGVSSNVPSMNSTIATAMFSGSLASCRSAGPVTRNVNELGSVTASGTWPAARHL